MVYGSADLCEQVRQYLHVFQAFRRWLWRNS